MRSSIHASRELRTLGSFGLLAGSLVAQACAEDAARHAGDPPAAVVQPELERAFRSASDEVAVIVNFRDPAPEPARAAAPAAIRNMQEQMLAAQRDGFRLSRRYHHIPALAGRITRQAFEQLEHDPNVAYIQLDNPGGGQLMEAVPAIGGDKVKRMYDLTGRGVRVAVLDTGIVTQHPDLIEAVVAEHCFTQFDCPPYRLPEGMSAEDDHGHGSNVTGIITSDGVVAPLGFAPDAEIVAVKVDDFNDSGQESDWAAGLDWVFENLPMLKVKVINLSICTIAVHPAGAECDQQHPALARAVQNLVDAGVTIFAASGNRGSPTTMSAPACISGVIAVGATYDANVGRQPPMAATYAARWGQSFANCSDETTEFDQIGCFTNSNARLDLVAPGAPMLSDTLNNMTELYWGTSQASPVAAGVAALMLECDPELTPAEIKQAMVDTGVPRMDPKNGLSFPSLRALEAVQAVCMKGDAGVPSADAGMAEPPSAGTAGALPQAGQPGGGTGGSLPPAVAGTPAPSPSAGAGAAAGNAGLAAPMPTLPPPTFPAPAPAPADAEAGCSCRAVGSPQPSPLRLPIALLVVLGLIARRRRGRR